MSIKRSHIPRAGDHPLKTWRLAQTPAVSQTELARRLGVARAHICLIEARQRQISLDLLPKLARITGLAPDIVRPDLVKTMRLAAIAAGAL